MKSKPGTTAMVAPVLILAVFFFFVVGCILLSNLKNLQVPAGYVGYLFTRPIVGKGKYVESLLGPTSSGLRWRTDCELLSITPFTYSEEFAKAETILAHDKLPLNGRCHIVWKQKADEVSVRLFMEHFGGLDQRQPSDTIARQAYEQFIREPFRTFVRSTVAKYEGLNVNDNLVGISQEIQKELTDYLKGTPFEVINVVMGNASPPDEVVNAISQKVATQQVLERKATEVKIAEQEVAISTLKGKASGAALAAEAIEKAKAITSINEKLTPMYLQYSAIQNLQGAERVYVPLQGGLPLVGTVPVTK